MLLLAHLPGMGQRNRKYDNRRGHRNRRAQEQRAPPCPIHQPRGQHRHEDIPDVHKNRDEHDRWRGDAFADRKVDEKLKALLMPENCCAIAHATVMRKDGRSFVSRSNAYTPPLCLPPEGPPPPRPRRPRALLAACNRAPSSPPRAMDRSRQARHLLNCITPSSPHALRPPRPGR